MAASNLGAALLINIMLKYVCVIVVILFNLKSVAQFGPQRIISTEADGSRIIFAADIDGDNKIDILSANKFGENLTWYKNLDGQGNFGAQNIIANLGDAIHIHAADLDGDGDMDVLAVSYYFDMVVWYENLDGLGNFSSQKIISNIADGPYRVIATDIDGDGDMDVISGSDNSGIAWYENIDGNGNFGPTRVINAFAPNARSIATTDIDGDGDMDVVGSTSGSATVAWYENLDGLGSFGPQQTITTNGLSVEPIFTIDIDGDGDIDVIAATGGADKVAWYENLDGLGNFGNENIIVDNLLGAHAIYSVDLDNDGDNDVIATGGGAFDGLVIWFENLDGQGSFGGENIIGTQHQFPRSVIAADMDNDGDMDPIAASQTDFTIYWFENDLLGTAEFSTQNVTLYPNPTKGILHINTNENIKLVRLFDVLGRKVFQQAGNEKEVDLTNFQNGIYFLKITTDSGSLVQKVIKK